MVEKFEVLSEPRKIYKKMLEDIKNILTYFQYQSDNSNVVVSGDGPDTGTGAVPLKW